MTIGESAMSTSGIDHVNILTDDLDATCAFYAAVLGLVRTESPAAVTGLTGAWLRDANGNALVHLVWRDPARSFGEGHEPGLSTNAIHHVAFRCTGFDAARARIAALGLECEVNEGRLGLRQIMVQDPNAINVEMNFPEG